MGEIVLSNRTQRIMREIIEHGPVVAKFDLYDDFLTYKNGVYKHKTGKLIGYHHGRILAWGKDEFQVEYWKAAASFGGNGTFRIIRLAHNFVLR